MSLATKERAAISDELERSGPDRPTLCAGWTTRDLLAHLLVRERQPLAAGGIMVPALAPITERAMHGYTDTPWREMVAELRDGPPGWSPYRVGKVDEWANGAEFFVHHEDVRRGEPGWQPRDPDPERDAQLWTLIGRAGRLMWRRSPVGVVVRRPADGPGAGAVQVVRPGPGMVTLVGEPSELLLHAFGRDAVRVETEGAATDVAAFAAAARGM